MDAICAALHSFLQSQTSFESILLVPYRSMGTQLLEHYAIHYGGALGVRIHTPDTLALELCAQAGLACPLLDESSAALLVLSLLKENLTADNSTLPYFSALGSSCLTLSTAQELLECFHLLDQEQCTHISARFDDPRLSDLDTLHLAYTKAKEQDGLWDRFDLFRAALQLLNDRGLEIPLMLCTNLCAQGIIRRFVQKLADLGTLLPIPTAPGGSAVPSLFLPQSEAPISASLRFVQGYGAENEALFPFYDALKQQLPFGQVSILYADSALLPLLTRHAARLGVPLTLDSGLPFGSSPLFSLLSRLIAWHDDDCPVEGLADLMSMGLVIPHGGGLLRLLRKHNVGFQLSRYLFQLERAQADAQALAASDDDAQQSQGKTTLERLADWTALLQDLSELFKPQLTPEEGLKKLGTLLLQRYVKYQADTRAAEYGCFMDTAFKLLPRCSALSFPDFLSLLLEVMESAPWRATAPRDGAIHAAPISKGMCLCRANTYILGLGRDALTAPGQESTFLREEERAALGLPASDADLHRPLSCFLQTLACAQGRVTLCYNCFDTERMLALPPAPSYEVLRGSAAAQLFGYQRTAGFTASDHWLASGVCPAPVSLPAHTGSDLSATIAQHRFSASSLEVAMECPRRFYFQYILRISQSEPSIPKNCWLPANALGTLVHHTLERYYGQVILTGSQPDFEAVWAKCLEVCKAQRPPVAQDLMDRDIRKAKGMARAAIRYFDEEYANHQLLATEFTFGDPTAAQSVSRASFAPPEEMQLSFGPHTIHFTGTVDRLDRLPSGKLSILDYKTGSASTFLLGWEHKLQYFLYARALEQFSGEAVEQAVYLMLGRDSVQPIKVDAPSAQADCQTRLEALLTILSHEDTALMAQPIWDGTAFSTPDSDQRTEKLERCYKYCPYADICKEVRL